MLGDFVQVLRSGDCVVEDLVRLGDTPDGFVGQLVGVGEESLEAGSLVLVLGAFCLFLVLVEEYMASFYVLAKQCQLFLQSFNFLTGYEPVNAQGGRGLRRRNLP